MYRFLFNPRWMALHLAALALAVLFVNLGLWQLRRLETRQTRNALLESRLALESEPLDTLLAAFNPALPPSDPASLAYRPARANGHYDTRSEVLYRSTENYEGNPGYYLLTPLVLDDGRALIVLRGWVPFEFEAPPVAEAAPPEGEVSVTGVVNPERPEYRGALAALAPRDPPGDLAITAYIDTARLSEQMPYDLLPFYLELRAQAPPQTAELPLPPLPPEFSNGPHLGYAVQWFAFALIGVVGYTLLLRQRARERSKGSVTADPEAVV